MKFPWKIVRNRPDPYTIEKMLDNIHSIQNREIAPGTHYKCLKSQMALDKITISNAFSKIGANVDWDPAPVSTSDIVVKVSMDGADEMSEQLKDLEKKATKLSKRMKKLSKKMIKKLLL